jgi:hypothetical protein
MKHNTVIEVQEVLSSVSIIWLVYNYSQKTNIPHVFQVIGHYMGIADIDFEVLKMNRNLFFSKFISLLINIIMVLIRKIVNIC